MLIFNGDFVDRGDHQVEVIGVLLALKVALPDRVWLVRGNHEDKTMNDRYGFREACTVGLGQEFGGKIFKQMQDAFNQMPLACLVSETILVLHGGIGDGCWRLQDLARIQRPLLIDTLTTPALRWVYNILWSDPIEDSDKSTSKVFGAHPSPRGEDSTRFAWNVTKVFCARNGIGLVVRSHQSKQDSIGFEMMHEKMLARVFSARDYEGHGNDGAVLMIRLEDVEEESVPQCAKQILSVRPQVVRSVTKSRKDCSARPDDCSSTARRRNKKKTTKSAAARYMSH